MSTEPDPVARLTEVAPVLPVTDVGAALAHYARLGFETTAYGDGTAYGFADRGDVHLHLVAVAALDPAVNTSAAYLYVDDATALAAEWAGAEVEGRFIPPTATDYGLLEGAHVDPDGNLIRYGSPLPP